MTTTHDNWVESEGVYEAHRPFTKKTKLEPGYYKFQFGMGRAYAHPVSLKDDRHCAFNAGPAEKILAEIRSFWSGSAAYKELGVTHKRSILMYGPPGCGKSGILTSVIKQVVAMDGVAVCLDNLGAFKRCLPIFREIQASTPVVVVTEDLDEHVQYDEIAFLELLDGASTIGENLLFVSTTNNLSKIPERIRCRPSRVDTLIEIGFPVEQQRREYIKFLLEKVSISNPAFALLVKHSENFSLADIKELVISTYIYKKDPAEAAKLIASAKGSFDPKSDEDDVDFEDGE